MSVDPVVKFGWFVAGVVIGGAVAVGVMELVIHMTEEVSSSEEDDVTNSIANSTGTRVQKSLQFVLVVSRHGNRGGYSDYTGDPYPLENTTLWPYGTKGLTQHGRVQEYKLGMKLRSMYDGFLPTTFHPKDIYATSDLVERVILSGELVLAGLYPPTGWQVWNSSIHWQPIPLYTNYSENAGDIESCQRFQQEKVNALTTFLEQEAANMSLITSYLYNQTGKNFTTGGIFYLFDKLISEDTEGYTLPSWTKALYPEPLTDFIGKFNHMNYAGTDEMVKLFIGDLYEGILDQLNSKAAGLSDKLLVYYSAHDTTILTLEAALGVTDTQLNVLVKTGSALVIELHKADNSSEYNVEVVYIDGSSLDSEPASLSLPDCGDPCSLDYLVTSTSRFTNDSFTDECQTNSSSTLS